MSCSLAIAASNVSVELYDGSINATNYALYSPNAMAITKAAGSSFLIKGNSSSTVSEVGYKWDDTGEFSMISSSSAYISVPAFNIGEVHLLTVVAKDKDGTLSKPLTFSIYIDTKSILPIITTPKPVTNTPIPRTASPIKETVTPRPGVVTVIPPKTTNLPGISTTPSGINPTSAPSKDELVIEPWMKKNNEISTLAVSLRNDSSKVAKANKNIYSLNEEITYYVDFKNGGNVINNNVSIVLELPLSAEIVDMAGGAFDSVKNTITWTYSNMKKGYEGTNIVKIKYLNLSNSNKVSEIVYPVAKIYNNNLLRDVSAVINYIYLNSETRITESHEPYMFGDQNGRTFRPNDTITRAEGAIVLARILGISYASIYVDGTEFSDILDTYPEAQKAIVAATRIGIINGYTDGTYRPNITMTKAQFMKILAAFIDYDANERNINGLDVKKKENTIKDYNNPITRYIVGESTVTSHWALYYINLLLRLNLTPVSSANRTIGLDNEITRAEVAQLINFYLNRGPAVNGTATFTDVPKNHRLYADIVEATRGMHMYYLTEEGREIVK